MSVQSVQWHIAGLAVLVLAVLSTGVALINSAQHSRQLTSELKILQRIQEEMQVEWLQMQLEQSAVTSKVVVDHVAREYLKMITPEPAETIYLRP